MKKICFVTAARSEYGLVKWLMSDLDKCEEFKLQLIVTGAHLSQEQGYTIDQIIDDGFKINYIVDSKLETISTAKIAESMGRMAEGIAQAFDLLKPDFLLILGDRYELLPICSTAFIMRIPIIHLSGGDVTLGAIDDGVRNAITMLADYHFPGTKDSAENIVRMRGNNKNIWVVGEPGLDSFNRERQMGRLELAENLCLDQKQRWGLMTYHPETKKGIEYNIANVKSCMESLVKLDGFQTVITYANADFGGKKINEYIEEWASKYPQKIKVIPSLGHSRYLSYMRQVDFVIGNSSSGIVEAPFLNIPVINIGDRQKGRYQCGNIIQCKPTDSDIKEKINTVVKMRKKIPDDLDYWGDGYTSKRIINILQEICLD